MAQALKRPRTLVILFSALLLTTLCTWVIWPKEVEAQASPPDPPAVDDAEIVQALYRSGLTPEALAATGVQGDTLDGLFNNTAAGLADAPNALANADAAYGQARTDRNELKRLIQSGQGDENDVTAYNSAVDDFTAASGARESAIETIRAEATVDLAEDAQTLVSTIDGNSRWILPVQYLVTPRTEAEWVALRDALANIRISEESGDDPDPDAVALLQQVESDQAVNQAALNLEMHLDSVEQGFEDPTS